MSKPIALKRSTDLEDFLTENKIPFEIGFTSSTTYITRKDNEGKEVKYICADGEIKMKDLNFILRVKKYAINCGKPNSGYTSSHVSYFKWNKGIINDGTFLDTIEIDVNGAYWEIALKLGYINKSLYEEGLKVDKKIRLIALGSLATKKMFYYFDGEKMNFLEEKSNGKTNEITRSYFFHVAYELGKIMSNVINKVGSESIYFYWVDAFFLKSYAKPAIIEEFKNYGLKVKVIDIYSMVVKKTNREEKKIYITQIKNRREDRTDIKIKPFYMMNPERRKRKVKEDFKKIIKKLKKDKAI